MPEPVGATCRLVLLRHAETPWNADGRWQGQTGVGLSPLGLRQAEATAAHVAAVHPDAVLIARSDSLRVAETAAPLEARLDVPVVVDERLREIDVGAWSGRTSEEVRAFDPDGWAALHAGAPVPVGGGETVAALRARMLAALDDVVGKVGDGTGVVVTHGWALRVAVAALLDLPPAEADAVARVANCSVTVVDVGPQGAALAGYGACDHLTADDLMSPRRGATGRG